ncbi:hypothetical protein, partial [Suttonella ornithocola]
NKKFPDIFLHNMRFIENKDDSNWYTIDTKHWAPNNISKQELKNYSDEMKEFLFGNKNISQCPPKEDNAQNEKAGESCLILENRFKTEEKYNRFYGYMAWNLGDIKVFCPYGYETQRTQLGNNEEIKQSQQNTDEAVNHIETNVHYKCLQISAEHIKAYY